MNLMTSELTTLFWSVFKGMLVAIVLLILYGAIKGNGAEIERLRVEKEALTKILLAFLRGQIETKAPEANKAGGEKHE
jgi:hypothetical protein